MIPLSKRVNLNDATDHMLRLVQENLGNLLDLIARVPILDGVQLSGVALSTSDTEVAHKLGRVSQGFIVTNRNAAQTVYQSTTAPSDSSRAIVLKASGAVTVDLWVY